MKQIYIPPQKAQAHSSREEAPQRDERERRSRDMLSAALFRPPKLKVQSRLMSTAEVLADKQRIIEKQRRTFESRLRMEMHNSLDWEKRRAYISPTAQAYGPPTTQYIRKTIVPLAVVRQKRELMFQEFQQRLQRS